MLGSWNVLSCEDAAQQVLVSVCLCVCLSKFQSQILRNAHKQNQDNPFQDSTRQEKTVKDNTRQYKIGNKCNANEYISLHAVTSAFQNVPECCRMHAECSRVLQNGMVSIENKFTVLARTTKFIRFIKIRGALKKALLEPKLQTEPHSSPFHFCPSEWSSSM